MNQQPLQYASADTPHRAPVKYWILGAVDVLLGCAVIVAVPLAMIVGSMLILMRWWVLAAITLSIMPIAIVGGIRLSDVIGRARRKIIH